MVEELQKDLKEKDAKLQERDADVAKLHVKIADVEARIHEDAAIEMANLKTSLHQAERRAQGGRPVGKLPCCIQA